MTVAAEEIVESAMNIDAVAILPPKVGHRLRGISKKPPHFLGVLAAKRPQNYTTDIAGAFATDALTFSDQAAEVVKVICCEFL